MIHLFITGRKIFINSMYPLNLSVAFLQVGKHFLKQDSDHRWSQWICAFPPIHKKVLHLKTVDFSPCLLNYLTQENSFASFTFLTTYAKSSENVIFLWKICLEGKKNKQRWHFQQFSYSCLAEDKQSSFPFTGCLLNCPSKSVGSLLWLLLSHIMFGVTEPITNSSYPVTSSLLSCTIAAVGF